MCRTNTIFGHNFEAVGGTTTELAPNMYLHLVGSPEDPRIKIIEYHLFNGAAFIDYLINIPNSNVQLSLDERLVSLDFMYEGKFVCTLPDGRVFLMKPGDFKIDKDYGKAHAYTFPLSRLHGASFLFSIDRAQKEIKQLAGFKDLDIDDVLEKQLCGQRYDVLANNEFLASFAETLIHLPETGQIVTLRGLALSLLNYLSTTSKLPSIPKTPSFRRDNLLKIARLRKFVISHLDERFSQEQLSERFEIPLTTMKEYFKAIYGTGIGQYVIEYKMHQAAKDLMHTRLPIAKIARKYGYQNTSKFSTQFHAIIGCLPKDYRKEKLRTQY